MTKLYLVVGHNKSVNVANLQIELELNKNELKWQTQGLAAKLFSQPVNGGNANHLVGMLHWWQECSTGGRNGPIA